MSWFDWRDEDDDPEDELSAFESAQLRAMHDIVRQYEETNRQYHDLLYWLATRIVPGEVDQRLTKDPFAFARMKPDGWRKFYQNALKDVHLSRWLAPTSPDTRTLQRENEQLRQQLAAAEAQIAELKAERDRLQQTVIANRRVSSKSQKAEESPKTESVPIIPEPHFTIPKTPPKKYATLFNRQESTRQRELIFLALAAGTGYSTAASLRWELTRYVEELNDPDAGSIKRLIERLEKANLISTRKVAKTIILSLTDLGREVATAMGVPPVETEWERLMRLHGGAKQEKHAAHVCLFTHYARKRGWRTLVCPEVEPPADPDVLIEKDDQLIYVEVEAGSGDPERRMKKWRNQRNLQGFAAICAPTENVRRMLVQEARSNTKRGMATDFMWLREPENDLWAETW